MELTAIEKKDKGKKNSPKQKTNTLFLWLNMNNFIKGKQEVNL